MLDTIASQRHCCCDTVTGLGNHRFHRHRYFFIPVEVCLYSFGGGYMVILFDQFNMPESIYDVIFA
ncbi:MAG: hypothetical protein ACMXYM_04750, partial [Candidatus Woesearchaeota archaeon]